MIGVKFMFILSVKSVRLKKLAGILLVAAIIIIGGTVAVMSKKSVTVGSFSDISVNAGTHEERKSFFSQFGWEISDEPLEVKETVIPQEFDDTYESYNELQKKQNFNLEKYKGIRVKAWSYEIFNYPDRQASDGKIRGNLLTCNGKVIGGDICSVELDGFMHGFSLPQENIKGDIPSLPQAE